VDRCGGYVADCRLTLWAMQSPECIASIEKIMLTVIIIIIIIIIMNVMVIIIIIIIRNVVHGTYDHTGNNWSHWNSNKRFKEKIGRHSRKTFNRLTTKDSYTWNITHNTEITAV
jgi:hypothetical protein